MAGAYQTGIYRNVLKECGYEETAITERLEQTFETIFYGTEAERFYHEAGDDMAYLEDTGNHDVRTEGMSYGMMVCVQLDKKAEFDRLWKWVRTYMYIPEGPCRNYFAWSCSTDGTHNAEGPAPDGEEYFAMALFFASARPPNGQMQKTMPRRRIFRHGIVFCICPLGGRGRNICLQQRGKGNPAGMYSQRGAWTSGRTYVGAFQSSDQICHKHGFF